MSRPYADLKPIKCEYNYTSAVTYAFFDEGKRRLNKKGFEIPYTWQLAGVRMQAGYESDIADEENWVREGVVYFKKDNPIFARTGLPFLHPEEFRNFGRIDKYYTDLNKQEIEKARSEGLEIKDAKLLKLMSCRAPFYCLRIPLARMGEDKYGVWLFGGEGTDKQKSKRAQLFGDWLRGHPYIDQSDKVNLEILLVEPRDLTGVDFADQLMMDKIGTLRAAYRSPDCHYLVRGIKTAKAKKD